MDLHGGDGHQPGQVLPEGVRAQRDDPGADPGAHQLLGEKDCRQQQLWWHVGLGERLSSVMSRDGAGLLKQGPQAVFLD